MAKKPLRKWNDLVSKLPSERRAKIKRKTDAQIEQIKAVLEGWLKPDDAVEHHGK